MNIATNIKKIREITGLTQSDFAAEIGLSSPSRVSDIEMGKVKPSGSVIIAIEHRFGHLFEWIEEPSGTKYIIPKPQQPPSTHDHTEEKGYYIQPDEWHLKLDYILEHGDRKDRAEIKGMLTEIYEELDKTDKDSKKIA